VEKAPVKRKKPKKAHVDPDGIGLAHPEAVSSTAAVPDRKVIDTTTSKAELPDVAEPDEDVDIFAGAGDYEDDIDDEQEEGEAEDNLPDALGLGDKYFEDQEELIPKFQTYRSPTPPPREARQEARRDNQEDAPTYNPYAESASDEPIKPQRLEGLSSSAYTARDLLAYDDAQARDEKRKLKKLKGKEKKEAMAREAEYDGAKNAEQKEKDRLNREVQEYEKYERKKGRAQS
jgi:IK cytokine